MTPRPAPPFRADHVGSVLRPKDRHGPGEPVAAVGGPVQGIGGGSHHARAAGAAPLLDGPMTSGPRIGEVQPWSAPTPCGWAGFSRNRGARGLTPAASASPPPARDRIRAKVAPGYLRSFQGASGYITSAAARSKG